MECLVLSTLQMRGVVFVDFDQVDERLDAEVRERHELFVATSVDPDHAVLGIHFHSDVVQPSRCSRRDRRRRDRWLSTR